MLWLLLLLALQIARGLHHECPGIRRFEVKFQGLWTDTTHPINYPDDAHFSPLVLVGHTRGTSFPAELKAFQLFREGGQATPGLEQLAEKGKPALLVEELNQFITDSGPPAQIEPSIANIEVSEPPTGTAAVGSITLEITIDGGRQKISGALMVAPSSDFFTGFEFLACDVPTGKWKAQTILDAVVYDAGTGAGDCLTCPDIGLDMNPADPIKKLTCDGENFCSGGGPVKVGKFIITDLGPPCEGEREYTVTFDAAWTIENFPVDYPSDAHFSPLVGAGHNIHYNVFPSDPFLPCCRGLETCVAGGCFCAGPGGGIDPASCPTNTCAADEFAPGGCCDPSPFCQSHLASAGLEQLAETGNGATILQEAKQVSEPGCCGTRGTPDVLSYGQTDDSELADGGIVLPAGTATLTLTVDGERSTVSAVAMAAPSSDYFVGIDSIELCDVKTGDWKEEVVIPQALVYDAGTDAGNCLVCDVEDDDEQPRSIISIVECGQGVFCGAGESGPSIGSFKIVDRGIPCVGKRVYKFLFTGAWSQESFPLNYPSDAHFSLITVLAHNEHYNLFETGGMVSPGMEVLAEKGLGCDLQKELDEDPNVLDWCESSELPTSGVGQWKATIIVSGDYPYISAAAMAAPSSDWFVGVHDINMCDTTTGEWKHGELIEKVRVYDAGTDSGDCLICGVEDDDTQPQEPVHVVGPGENFCEDCEVDLGKFAIIDEGKACTGMASYHMAFRGVWNRAKFPLQYPDDAHFSQFIVASHTPNSHPFSANQRNLASPGLEILAESGMTDALKEELIDDNNVGDVAESQNKIEFGRNKQKRTVEIKVDPHTAVISGAAMAAPSSDWFILFDSVQMCDGETGEWKEELTVDKILVFSAGTDAGMCFTCEDEDRDPQIPVAALQTPIPGGYFCEDCELDLGDVTFTKRGIPCQGQRLYNLNFDGVWSRVNHPLNYPSDAHFSQFTVASHNMEYELFKTGFAASEGLEVLAELGMGETLQKELAMNPNVLDISESINRIEFGEGTQKRTVQVLLDGDHSKISGAAMIAPSSAWFIGFSGIEMCNMETGEWKQTVELSTVRAYDAGTDNGNCFNCPDDDANPINPVSVVPSGENFIAEGEIDLGDIRFVDAGLPCPGSQTYMFIFQGAWNEANHPLNYPSDAHFSGFTIASHSHEYQMWEVGGLATEGFEVLSEFGIGAVLQEEARDSDDVHDVTESPGSAIGDGDAKLMAQIEVDTKHPLISAAAMLAPSSDWFTGLNDLNMCNAMTGEWKMLVEIPVATAYDAGTDSGDCFVCTNQETTPNEMIEKVPVGVDFVAEGTIDVGDIMLKQFMCKELDCEECRGDLGTQLVCVFTGEGCMDLNDDTSSKAIDYCPREKCPTVECKDCSSTPGCAMTTSGCMAAQDAAEEDVTTKCPIHPCGTFCCEQRRTIGRMIEEKPDSANESIFKCYEACLAIPTCKVYSYNHIRMECTLRRNRRLERAVLGRADLTFISGTRECDPAATYMDDMAPATCDCCSTCPA